MPALPLTYLTNELHVVPSVLLQTGPPAGVQISKYFYKPQVDQIKTEYLQVKNMGSATLDEWLKGLEARGKQAKTDALRWERWETKGGIQKMRQPDDEAEAKNPTATVSAGDHNSKLSGPSMNLAAKEAQDMPRVTSAGSYTILDEVRISS